MSLNLCIISGKGGTGKSSVSYGLGCAFSLMGKSVLLVDLDEGLHCLDIISGNDAEVVNDLSDIIDGGSIDSAIYKSEIYENLKLIPAPYNTGVINYVNLSALCKRLDGTFDVIIYDFPAGIDKDKLSAVGNDAQFLIVSNMDKVSLGDAAAIRNALPKTKYEPRLIINRFYSEYIKDGIFSNIDDMIDKSSVRLAGIVPSSFEIATLSESHKFHKNSRSLSAFKRIAGRLSGEDIKLPKIKKI